MRVVGRAARMAIIPKALTPLSPEDGPEARTPSRGGPARPGVCVWYPSRYLVNRTGRLHDGDVSKVGAVHCRSPGVARNM